VGLHQGTRALALIDPIVTQEIGLFRADGEIVMPMANAFVTMVKKLNESGELRTRFSSEFSDGPLAPSPLRWRRNGRYEGGSA
jgi:hypothetical protein